MQARDPRRDHTARESPGGPSALEAALTYLRRGWRVIYLPLRSKNPGRTDWQLEQLTESDLRERLTGVPKNISGLLGDPSGGLTDIDLDTPEALMLADAFLPTTGSIFGRPGKPRSHWLYYAEPMVPTAK